jgi:hypothetical protein
MTLPLIDPIAHAWQFCNPHAPLPAALARYAPSGFALSLYSYRGQLATERSGTSQDVQYGLLTLAALARPSVHE